MADNLIITWEVFKHLVNHVSGWPQKALIGTFLGGLKEDIAGEVRMFKLKSLRETIELTSMKEERLAR